MNDMQFGCMPGKGTTLELFIFCEGHERNSVKKRKICAYVL